MSAALIVCNLLFDALLLLLGVGCGDKSLLVLLLKLRCFILEVLLLLGPCVLSLLCLVLERYALGLVDLALSEYIVDSYKGDIAAGDSLCLDLSSFGRRSSRLVVARYERQRGDEQCPKNFFHGISIPFFNFSF